MVASKRAHYCESCGFKTTKWLGRCPECGEWNSLIQDAPAHLASAIPTTRPQLYEAIENEQIRRFPTGISEFDRAMGKGIVAGSVTLLGGEPGIGKSTLLLQIAESLSRLGNQLLYVAGEESPQQIKLRGKRLGLKGEGLYLTAETSVERICAEAVELRPDALFVDSVQTIFSEKLEAIPSSIAQVRECAMQLLNLAKRHAIPVILVGHITKDGALAGPKSLEHIVDTVLYFEGDRHQDHKIIRAVKNRFGPANEIGIFEMTARGLRCLENPSQFFLVRKESSIPGSVVMCALQGSRPLLVELQALVSQTRFSTARRTTTGIDPNRVSLLLAMLEKRTGLTLLGDDVFINAAGGILVSEPAADLALVSALVSSIRNHPLPGKTVVFGELGLAGEVRSVSFPSLRVREASNMGFDRVILPAGNLPLNYSPANLSLLGVSSVSEFLEVVDL